MGQGLWQELKVECLAQGSTVEGADGETKKPEPWKLVASLAADVAGFSRLTGADEDRTLARLWALRSDLIEPTISVHNGRGVKRSAMARLLSSAASACDNHDYDGYDYHNRDHS